MNSVAVKIHQFYAEQESPPAWTQEAYRPPCSKYSLHVVLTGYPPRVPTPPGQGTPPARVTPPGQGTPPRLDLAGYPPPPRHSGKCCKALWDTGTPPWHSGKCCKALWDMGTPPPRGQTNKVKVLHSRRTTYAGGNYLNLVSKKWI